MGSDPGQTPNNLHTIKRPIGFKHVSLASSRPFLTSYHSTRHSILFTILLSPST